MMRREKTYQKKAYYLSCSLQVCFSINFSIVFSLILLGTVYSLNFIFIAENQEEKVNITFLPYKIKIDGEIESFNTNELLAFLYKAVIKNITGETIREEILRPRSIFSENVEINGRQHNLNGLTFEMTVNEINNGCIILEFNVVGKADVNGDNSIESFDEKRSEILCNKKYSEKVRNSLNTLFSNISNNQPLCFSLLIAFAFLAAAYYARFGGSIVSLYDIINPRLFKLKEPTYSLLSLSPRGEVGKKLKQSQEYFLKSLIEKIKKYNSKLTEKELIAIEKEISKNPGNFEKILAKYNVNIPYQEKKDMKAYLQAIFNIQPTLEPSFKAKSTGKVKKAVDKALEKITSLREKKFIGKPLSYLLSPAVLLSRQISFSIYGLQRFPRVVLEATGIATEARRTKEYLMEKGKKLPVVVEKIAGEEKVQRIVDVKVLTDAYKEETEELFKRTIFLMALEISFIKKGERRQIKEKFKALTEEIADIRSSNISSFNELLKLFDKLIYKDKAITGEQLRTLKDIFYATSSKEALSNFIKLLKQKRAPESMVKEINRIYEKLKFANKLSLAIALTDIMQNDLRQFSEKYKLVGPFGDTLKDKNLRNENSLFYLFLNHFYNSFKFIFTKDQIEALDINELRLLLKTCSKMAVYELISSLYGYSDNIENIKTFYSELVKKLESEKRYELARAIKIEIIDERLKQAKQMHNEIFEDLKRLRARSEAINAYIGIKKFGVEEEAKRELYVGFVPPTVSNEDIEKLRSATFLILYLPELAKSNLPIITELMNSLMGTVREEARFEARVAANVLSSKLPTILENRSNGLMGAGIDNNIMKRDMLLGYIIYLYFIYGRGKINNLDEAVEKLKELSEKGVKASEIRLAEKMGFVIGKTKDNEITFAPSSTLLKNLKEMFRSAKNEDYMKREDTYFLWLMKNKIDRIGTNPLLFFERFSADYMAIGNLSKYYVLQEGKNSVIRVEAVSSLEAYSFSQKEIEKINKELAKIGFSINELSNVNVERFNEVIRQLRDKIREKKAEIGYVELLKLSLYYYKVKEANKEHVYLGDIEIFRNPELYNIIIGTKEDLKLRIASDYRNQKIVYPTEEIASAMFLKNFLNTYNDIAYSIHTYKEAGDMPYLSAMNFYNAKLLQEFAEKLGITEKKEFKKGINLINEHFNAIGFFLDRDVNNAIAGYIYGEEKKYALLYHYRGGTYVPGSFLYGREGFISMFKNHYIEAPLFMLSPYLFSLAVRIAEPKIRLFEVLQASLSRVRYSKSAFDIGFDFDEVLREYLKERYGIEDEKFLRHIKSVNSLYYEHNQATYLTRWIDSFSHFTKLGIGYSSSITASFLGSLLLGPIGIVANEIARMTLNEIRIATDRKYSFFESSILARFSKEEIRSFITLAEMYYRASVYKEQLQWYKKDIKTVYGNAGNVLGLGYYTYQTSQLRLEPAVIRHYARWLNSNRKQVFNINAFRNALSLGNYRLADTSMLTAVERAARFEEMGKVEYNKLAYSFMFPHLVAYEIGKKAAKSFSEITKMPLEQTKSIFSTKVLETLYNMQNYAMSTKAAICPQCRRERRKNVRCPFCGYKGFV